MTQDRLAAIADHVRAQGEVRTDSLATHFGVSRMTILRHVDKLAQQGVLRKLHGAVTAQPSCVYESLHAYRVQFEPQIKTVLARAALAEIAPGQAVALDDSTTVTALGPFLEQIAPLTVITNSLALMHTLASADEITMIGVGGIYVPTYHAFIGPEAVDAIGRLRVNVALCSASGVRDGAALVQDGQVTGVKSAMLAVAERRVLLVSSGKFGRVALHRFASLDQFDAVYTDSRLPASDARALRDAGIALHLVDVA